MKVSQPYLDALAGLREEPKRWLITGVAGFIGSNLLQALLENNQQVVGLDNLITGHKKNLYSVKEVVGESLWSNFTFIEGDICSLDTCRSATKSIDYVLHQAALGSVPRSIEDPVASNASNVSGFLNMLVAAKDNRVENFVYAASSSTYGDSKSLPKIESIIGKPLSPYAVTKYINEIYAEVFNRCYGFNSIGLRYFNVFGPRQDPNGSYAAVIPRWVRQLIEHEPPKIFGTGETSRDFCYVENVVQANILAAVQKDQRSLNQVYNVAVGHSTNLNELYQLIRARLGVFDQSILAIEPIRTDFRDGDIRHSLASIEKASDRLGYEPLYDINSGLDLAMKWYLNNL
jgi:UDP-N-acetylglucosamine/UDP-N-acetylgalactosamine 4-epimerase